MGKVFIEETTLTNIGSAIREKTGKTDLIAPGVMPDEIRAIETAGAIEALEITANGVYTAPEELDGYNPITVNVPQDGFPTEEELTFKGDVASLFGTETTVSPWDWFIKKYGDNIKTENIRWAQQMFKNCQTITEIPFEINLGVPNAYTHFASFANMFDACKALTKIPKINYAEEGTECPTSLQEFFNSCYALKEITLEDFSWLRFDQLHNKECYLNGFFTSCNALEYIDEELLKQLYNLNSKNDLVAAGSFHYCHVLREVKSLPFPQNKPSYGTVIASYAQPFKRNYLMSEITFRTAEDGTPLTTACAGETLDLTDYIGWTYSGRPPYEIEDYKNKEVTDDASYQALKDTDDWWSSNVAYSYYNHDSAVNTINSLPDVSASGTNIIKFKGAAGELTDGGAINTLTAAEIAVATAKGWTVTLV